MWRVLTRIMSSTWLMVVVLTMTAVGLGVFLHYNRLHKLNSHFAYHQNALEIAYQAGIQMYRLAMESFFNNVICRPDIVRIFAEGVASTGQQRDVARGRLYRLLYPRYEAMQSQNLLQLHFHQPDGTSFLRFHKPDRHGDFLLDFRHSVQIANTERRPVHGFETGKIRSGFRYVYPLSYEGRHVGSVEVSVTAKGLREAMAGLDPHREYAFLLNRRLIEPHIFNEQKWLYSPSELHPGYILEDADALLPDSPPPLSSHAKAINRQLSTDQRIQQVMHNGEPATVGASTDEMPYIVSLLPIRDIKNQVAGYLVTYTPDEVSTIFRKEFITYLSTVVAALSLITVLFLSLKDRSVKLAREQQHLKVVSDALAEGVFVMDQNGAILSVNLSACRILGYDAAEMIGRSAHELFHWHAHNDYLDPNNCPIYNKICHGQPYDGEDYFQHKNGSVFSVEIASRPIRIQGDLVGSVAAFRDITERKNAEEALKRSEEKARKLSTAVEQSPTSIIITDADGAIEYVNPKFVESTGYSFEEAVGQTPRILKSGAMSAEVYAQLWSAIASGREWKGELQNSRKNGEAFWVFTSISPIRSAEGRITHYIAVNEDISDRKSMEEELREKEAIQRTLMESLPVGLIIVDARTRIIEQVNPTMARLFGAPAEAIIGHRCHQFLCPSCECNCPILDHGQKADNSDRILVRHDGSQLPILKTVNRIKIRGEEKLLECAVDIRNRIAAEKALQLANARLKAAIAEAEDLAEKAERANRAKSEFLANMSHELRTPLNHIIGFTDLVLSREVGELTTQQDEFLKDVLSSSQHLLALINDMLDLSKVEAGKIELELSEVRIRELLEGSLAMVKEKALQHNLRLAVDLDGVPDLLQADERKLKQIVYNLLSNAVKFTPPGGEVRLGARIQTGSALDACPVSLNASEIFLCVWVSDTGIGIQPHDLSRIFDPFEQADGSATRNYQGTGLGLALTRKMIKLHAGAIWAESPGAGQGSTFRFVIPA